MRKWDAAAINLALKLVKEELIIPDRNCPRGLCFIFTLFYFLTNC